MHFFFKNAIEIRTELVYDKSMPARRLCCTGLQQQFKPPTRNFFTYSPISGSVLSSWKRFVSTHRKNFNLTGRFLVCSEHFTDDCLALSYHVIHEMPCAGRNSISMEEKHENNRVFSRSSYGKFILSFLSLSRFNISLLLH